MPQDLVRKAIAESDRATADVRAAVRLRGARVIQKSDADEAERLIDEAIGIIATIRDPDVAASMRFIAVPLSAPVSPSTALRLLRELDPSTRPFGPPIDQMLHHMIAHGHRAEALAYLVAPDLDLPYPFGSAMVAARDAESQAAVLRTAIAAIRREMSADASKAKGGFQFHQFLSMFSHGQWRRLPPAEAASAVRDIAGWIVATPDRRTNSSQNDVRFSSTHASELFQILAPLRHLDPAFTETLVAQHPQLAKAAEKYPFGMESAMEAFERAQPPRPEGPPPEMPDYIYFESGMILGSEAVATRFADAFADADARYARDIDPEGGNTAPLERWPSTSAYRTILFHAGSRQGRDALSLLARIPNDDIRHLATIELAAAIDGLPQMGDLTVGPSGRRRQGAAEQPDAAVIAMIQQMMRSRQTEPSAPLNRPRQPASNEARIAPTTKAKGARISSGSGADFWVIEGAPLKPIIARLWDMPESRVRLPEHLGGGHYDFSLVLSHDSTREEMRRLMRAGIEKHFRVAVGRDAVSLETVVITAPHGVTLSQSRLRSGRHAFMSSESISWAHKTQNPDWSSPEAIAELMEGEDGAALGTDIEIAFDLELTPTDAPRDPEAAVREMSKRMSRLWPGRGGALHGIQKSMTVAELADLLEAALGRPVVDETGLTGAYDFKVEAEVDSTEAFMVVLAEKTGLVFSTAQREIAVLNVRPV